MSVVKVLLPSPYSHSFHFPIVFLLSHLLFPIQPRSNTPLPTTTLDFFKNRSEVVHRTFLIWRKPKSIWKNGRKSNETSFAYVKLLVNTRVTCLFVKSASKSFTYKIELLTNNSAYCYSQGTQMFKSMSKMPKRKGSINWIACTC